MDLGWVAIAFNDVIWLTLAFVLGFLSKSMGLPPLVGFLVTGFIINTQANVNHELFQKLTDLGITLLLFTIGLKINIKQLIKPHVWILSGVHMSIIVVLFGFTLYGLSFIGLSLLSGLTLKSALIVAFALSFSSTVFVVKALEDKGELKSLHGSIAIGILIMQDIIAVIFLAFTTNKMPSVWAFSLILLIPLKYFFNFVLNRVGHGELLVLFGFILALGGAEVFELVGMKGDLGALILGMIIASHANSDDLAKSMMGFKDLFLLGFFVSIGLSGQVTMESFSMAFLITFLIAVKAYLFFKLFLFFKLRARTSLLASINLGNYSEFGLIVAAIASANQWIQSEWLIIIAIAMSFSFIISSILNKRANHIYTENKVFFNRIQKNERITNDHVFDVGQATIMIVGMGTMGKGAYEVMNTQYPNKIIGVDIDHNIVSHLAENEHHIIQGDPSDADFWDRVQEQHSIELILLTLPKFNTTLAVIDQLKQSHFQGKIAAAAKYDEEIEELNEKGIMTVSNIFTNAGAGFASEVTDQFISIQKSQ
ncbi:MAG: cation:proton antiporter [Marinicellaceae bacterium]